MAWLLSALAMSGRAEDCGRFGQRRGLVSPILVGDHVGSIFGSQPVRDMHAAIIAAERLRHWNNVGGILPNCFSANQ